jgi:hypothetical protein
MAVSAIPSTGLAQLDALIESEINRGAPQTSALPQDTVTLSRGSVSAVPESASPADLARAAASIAPAK